MQNDFFSENWAITAPIAIVLGIVIIMYTIKHPNIKQNSLASELRGFISGLGFINFGLFLTIKPENLEERNMIWGIILLSTSIVFQSIAWYFQRNNQIKNKPINIYLTTAIFVSMGIYCLLKS